MAARILVIEGDRTSAEILAAGLKDNGFEAESAVGGESGLNAARSGGFDLIVCDAASLVPGVDATCRLLKADEATSGTPLIALAKRGDPQTITASLRSGADDFVAKPYEVPELVARIELCLERAASKRDSDPFTELPGNTTADSVLADRISRGEGFALLLMRVNGLRAYCEVYGPEKYGEVIRMVSGIIKDVVRKKGTRTDIPSYLGGTDFSLLTSQERAESHSLSVIRLFDARIRDFYSDGDLERGGIVTFDRRGDQVDNPIMTISIGGASNAHRVILSHWEAAEIAREVLSYAMSFPSSTYCMDRRRDRAEALT